MEAFQDTSGLSMFGKHGLGIMPLFFIVIGTSEQ